MKRLRAIVAASVITGLVACGMLTVGVSAALNRNGVTPSNSPASASATTSDPPASGSSAQAQIAQLQAEIQQYQNREQQYQSELDQATNLIQSYQQVLLALQQSGVIRITGDGRILLEVPNGAGG